MNKGTRIKLVNYIYPVIVFLCAFFVLRNVTIVPGDDLVYKNILQNTTYFTWVKDLYLSWSGRVFLTSLLVFFLNHNIIIIKIINAILLTSIVLVSQKFGSSTIYSKIFSFCLIFLIPEKFLSSSVFWITGSLNYLWPISLLMILLFYVYNTYTKQLKLNNIQFIVLILFTILVSNNEQTALIFITFLIIYIFIDYRDNQKFRKEFIILFSVSIIFSAITYLSPGNFNRLNSEIISLFPSFDTLTVFDKIFIGFNFATNVLFSDFEYYLLLMSILLFIVNKKENKFSKVVSVIPIVIMITKITFNWISVCFPYCSTCNDLNYILFNYRYFEVFYSTELIHIVPIVMALIFYISTGLNIYFAKYLNSDERVFYTLLLLAALFSSIILGFSPTIEASGNRIYLFMIISILMINVFLLSKTDLRFYNFDLRMIIVITLIIKTIMVLNYYAGITIFNVIY